MYQDGGRDKRAEARLDITKYVESILGSLGWEG